MSILTKKLVFNVSFVRS